MWEQCALQILWIIWRNPSNNILPKIWAPVQIQIPSSDWIQIENNPIYRMIQHWKICNVSCWLEIYPISIWNFLKNHQFWKGTAYVSQFVPFLNLVLHQIILNWDICLTDDTFGRKIFSSSAQSSQLAVYPLLLSKVPKLSIISYHPVIMSSCHDIPIYHVIISACHHLIIWHDHHQFMWSLMGLFCEGQWLIPALYFDFCANTI